MRDELRRGRTESAAPPREPEVEPRVAIEVVHLDSILGMAMQLPALKSIGESIGVDLSSAVGPLHVDAAPAAASTGAKPLPKS